VDSVCIQKILPGKMRYNLHSVLHFSFWGDIRTMFRTVFAVLGKDYPDYLAQE
jgi:lipopolysaccharide/colanic/teichoic acid biosynthesis glycosyltransferase